MSYHSTTSNHIICIYFQISAYYIFLCGNHLPFFYIVSCMCSMNSQYNTGHHLSTSMHTRHMVVLHFSVLHALTHTHYSPVSRRVIINPTAPVTAQSSGCRYCFSCWLVYSVRARSDHSQYKWKKEDYINFKSTSTQIPIFGIRFSQDFLFLKKYTLKINSCKLFT